MSFTRHSRNSGNRGNVTPFCKVCYDAGLPTENFTSHFVKDQPGPNGIVVCPTLLAQKCLICGVPGHTSSYCPDNSSVSTSSTIQTSRMAMATDEIRNPSHSIRLPPIQTQNRQQNSRPVPRIVYPDNPVSNPIRKENEFPSLPNLSSLRRFENDEPKLRRTAEASPVHSPLTSPSPKKLTKVKYNKKNNPFGDLDDENSDSDSERKEMHLPIIPKQDKERKNPTPSSSWASIAAGKSAVSGKPQQQRERSRFSILVPTAISTGPLLPPISFKPKPVSTSEVEKKKQTKKLWGDTDSEDDEEFLKRGLVQVGEKTLTLPEP